MSAPPGGSSRRPDWVAWLERRVNVTEIFSFLTHFGLVYTPVESARPVRETMRDLARQPVPAYLRGARALGLLTVILFAMQLVTGVLLAFCYRPTPEAAFQSTRSIVRDLPFGWLIHQTHAWGAWALVVVVAARLSRLFWEGLYRAPRELLWWSAIAVVVIALQFDFTGRLLTWEAHDYWTTVRGLEVVNALPILGPMLSFFLGGPVVNEDVLLRFYVVHLLVLPAAFAAFLYLTAATIRRVGLSAGASPAPGETTTLRDHLYEMAIFTVILFGAIVSLAVLTPFRFGAAVDPYVTPSGIRAPWYLLAPHMVIQVVPGPSWIAGLLLLALTAVLLLLPLWAARWNERDLRRMRLAGLTVLIAWTVFTLAGALMERP